VLLAARQHLDDALDLLLAPDHGVELALAGELREIAAELFGRRRLGALLALGRRGRGRRAAEQLERLLAYALAVDAQLEQHLGRDALAFAGEDAAQGRCPHSAA